MAMLAKSASSLNKKLGRTTIQGRFKQVCFPDRPGADSWRGAKAVFRALYKTMYGEHVQCQSA